MNETRTENTNQQINDNKLDLNTNIPLPSNSDFNLAPNTNNNMDDLQSNNHIIDLSR